MRGLTLDRYVLSELGLPFSLAIGGLLFVLMTREMTRVTELLVMHGVSALVVLKLVVYILPSFMILTLPIATLIASTCAFSRFASDHELVAMQASGIGFRRLLIPVGIFSIGIYAVAFALSFWAQPWSGASLKTLALSMIQEQLTLPLAAGVFNDPVDGIGNPGGYPWGHPTCGHQKISKNIKQIVKKDAGNPYANPSNPASGAGTDTERNANEPKDQARRGDCPRPVVFFKLFQCVDILPI